MSMPKHIDTSNWEHEYIPQSIIFEAFANGSLHVMWGISLWPNMESFFVNVTDHHDVNLSPWGTSEKYDNYQDAFDCVLAYLQMNESEYKELVGDSRNKYSRAIMKMLSKFKE